MSTFKPSSANVMRLDTPYAKSKPIANWTKLYKEGKFRGDNPSNLNNGNIAWIPDANAKKPFIVVDMDTDSAKRDLSDEDFQKYHVEFLNQLIESCNHVVKTPHGYHLYFKPSDSFPNEDRRCNIKIDTFTKGETYVLAPESEIKERGSESIIKYKFLKWEGKELAELGDLGYILDEYTKRKESVSEKKITTSIKKSERKSEVIKEEDVYTPENVFEAWAFSINWGDWGDIDNYKEWVALGYRLHKISQRYGEDSGFRVFHKISRYGDSYNKPNAEGLSGKEMVKSQWSKLQTDRISDSHVEAEFTLFQKLCCEVDPEVNAYNELCKGGWFDMFCSTFLTYYITKVFLLIPDKFGKDGGTVAYSLDGRSKLWRKTNLTNMNHTIGMTFYNAIKSLLNRYHTNRLPPCNEGYKSVVLMDDEEVKAQSDRNIKAFHKKAQSIKKDFEGQPFMCELQQANYWNFTDLTKNQHKYSENRNSTNLVSNIKGALIQYAYNNNIDEDRLDNQPTLLPLQDAYCVNLKTGAIVPRTPEHFFTHCCRGKSTEITRARQMKDRKFDVFMSEICCKDEVSVKYAQKVLGWFSTGDNLCQKFCVMQGSGRNGKSVLLDCISHVLNEFTKGLPSDAMVKRGVSNKGGPSPHLAECEGKRFVFQDELGAGEELDNQFVKTISGASRVSARMLHKNNRSFVPFCASAVLTNEDLNIAHLDQALRDRFIKFNFDAYFGTEGVGIYDSKNPNHFQRVDGLAETLKTKHIGSILDFIITGAMRYYEEGMNDVPDKWVGDLQEYFRTNNPIERYIDTCFTEAEGEKCYINDMLSVYKQYLIKEGYSQSEMSPLTKVGIFRANLNKTMCISTDQIKTNEINAKTGKAKLKRGKPYIKNLVYNVRWSNAYDNVEMQFKQNESDDEDTCELDH